MNGQLTAARSPLNPVLPLGVGTPDVESLISYFARVALSHCVTTSALARRIAYIMGWSLNPKWDWKFVNPSGVSGSAEQWSRALSDMTSVGALSSLTLLSWRNVVAPMSLTATSSRWCPLCFGEDCTAGTPPYFRLAWDINAVTACARHRTKLVHACAECGRLETRHRSAYIVPGWCTKCGAFLGSFADHTNSTPEETWVASQVGGMLARQATLESSPTREDLCNCIRSLVTHFDGGKNALFSRRIGLNKSTVHHLMSAGGTPTLPTLLRIASRTGIELPDLLTGDLTRWLSVNIEERSTDFVLAQRNRRASPVPRRSEQIRTHLAALNESNVPVSVRQVARQLNIDPRQLYRSAPEEAHTVGERWQRHRHNCAERNRESALKAIEAAYFDIVAEGKSVNLRELRNHVPRSVLGSVRSVFTLLEDVKRRIGVTPRQT